MPNYSLMVGGVFAKTVQKLDSNQSSQNAVVFMGFTS